jgi:hypothetical protein
MEATKSIMLLLEQIKIEATEYSRRGTKSYVVVLMKSELTLPIRMGYNFDSGLLLTRKSYVA